MSTHNLCFGVKIRKLVYPCISQFYYMKGYLLPGHVWLMSFEACWAMNLAFETCSVINLP